MKHVFEENQLMTDRQWAYRRGYSTELLLAHETWRKAVDSGLKFAVAFIDFKKAFDSVSHPILEHMQASKRLCHRWQPAHVVKKLSERQDAVQGCKW